MSALERGGEKGTLLGLADLHEFREMSTGTTDDSGGISGTELDFNNAALRCVGVCDTWPSASGTRLEPP